MKEKRCPCCKSLKSTEEFGLNKTKRDGYKTYCKQCSNEKARYHRNANIEKQKEKRRIYEKNNRDKILKQKRIYKINNVEKINEWNRSYAKANAEKILERSRLWAKVNFLRARETSRRRREANPEKARDYFLRWLRENPKRMLESRKRANRKARSTPRGCLNSNFSARISTSLRSSKKGRKWESLVGYTVDDLKKHLEKQFKEGMSWDNYGRKGWHIDHKIPKSVFNYEKPEDDDFKRCWALGNLQPLWAKDNIRKRNKLNKHFQPSLIF